MEKQNSQDSRRFERQEHAHQGREYGRVHQVQEREHHDHERIDHAREHVQHSEQQQAQHHGEQPEHKAQPHVDDVTIFIDHKAYHIKDAHITAADVRKIAVPPLGDDRDIFHVVGSAGSVKMNEGEVIEINMHEKEHGRHFLSEQKPQASSHDEVARRAYAIYLQRGCQHGRDLEDWIEAERSQTKE